jgi:hypothetical protein
MRLLLLALGAVLVAACGGRSALGTAGSWTDGKPSSKLDGGTRDAPRARDWRWPFDGRPPRDIRPQPRDRSVKDTCLPIPASQVTGSYVGGWKGSWKCPGQPWTSLSGDLSFKLTPAGSPDAFNVKGTMKGYVDPGFPFKSSITGTMGCTSLSAALPDIMVGSGGIMYQLTGQIAGYYQAYPTRRFPNGSWTAKQSASGSKCQASGSWYANWTSP